MAKKKTNKDAAGAVLVMKDGTRYAILSEQGKYFVCEGTQFRKGNPRILTVERKGACEDADH